MINRDPIISNRRTGTQDNQYQKISEPLIIDNSGIVQLTEYPLQYDRVVVVGDDKDWFETEKDLPNENEFKVNYEHKQVYFHISNIGKQLSFKYTGTGNSFFPATSIYVEREGLQVTETLDSLTKTTAKAKEDTEIATQNAIQETERAREVADNTRFIEPYNASITYKKNNIVSFNGSSYISKVDNNKGNTPPNPTVTNDDGKWALIGRKGADGNGTVATHKDTFVATEGQKVFDLSHTYDQFQDRTFVYVGGVPQKYPDNYEETSNQSITLSEGVPAGTEVVIRYYSEAVPMQSDIQTTVDNHTTAISNMQQKVGDDFVKLGKVRMRWNETTQSLDFVIED